MTATLEQVPQDRIVDTPWEKGLARSGSGQNPEGSDLPSLLGSVD